MTLWICWTVFLLRRTTWSARYPFPQNNCSLGPRAKTLKCGTCASNYFLIYTFHYLSRFAWHPRKCVFQFHQLTPLHKNDSWKFKYFWFTSWKLWKPEFAQKFMFHVDRVSSVDYFLINFLQEPHMILYHWYNTHDFGALVTFKRLYKIAKSFFPTKMIPKNLISNIFQSEAQTLRFHYNLIYLAVRLAA